jgi:hypothetical protein
MTPGRRLLHCGISIRRMTAMGHEQTQRHHTAMSALPLKADKTHTCWHVRLVPKADICSAANCSLFDDLVGSGFAVSEGRVDPAARTERTATAAVVAREAHDANEHLRSHREIVRIGGAARLAALAPITSTGRCNSAGSFHHGDKHRAPLESSR